MADFLHHSFSLFLLQAVVIIAFSRMLGLLARGLGQPLVIAEVAAGILLGPSLLGWISPNALETLFPPSSMPNLQMFSQIGLVFFMFLIGLELDPKLLSGRGRASVAISHTSIIVPFLLGSLLALYLYPRVSDPSVRFNSFALFMGAAMSITAFPVLARILAERSMLRTRIGAVTIACAAVDDVTAWCILAFVASIARAIGVQQAIWTTVLALLYTAIMFWVVRPFLARLADRGFTKEGLTQNLVAVVFLFVLISSGITETIGIHALFGAFLLGAITPRSGGYAQVLAEKIEDFVVVFLLPLFFAYSGLRTQVNLLNTSDAWLWCALIILVACLGKFGGGALAARLTGLTARESCALGILMNTRGLMELIVLNIGLDLGIISPLLFTMMVLMALVTTFMTTPLLQWAYPEARARREERAVEAMRPSPREPEEFQVLLCVADQRTGSGMANLASALAQGQEPPVRALALHLMKPMERTSAYLRAGENIEDGMALVPLMTHAAELGLKIFPFSYTSAEPGEEICRFAESKGVDLIVLGCHRPLLNQTFLGGTVFEVLSQAGPEVGVLIDRGLTATKRVLVPFVGSPHDRAALRVARRLSRQAGASVTILHVVPPGRESGEPRLGAEDLAGAFFPDVSTGDGGVNLQVVPHQRPIEVVIEEAGRGYDLVVVGIGREWGLEQRQFGFFSETMIQKSPISILVIRGRRDRP